MEKDLLDEDDDFRARMYGNADEDEDEVATRPATGEAKPNGIMNMIALSHEVRRLNRVIEEQDRGMRRLENRLRRLESHTNGIGRAVNEIDRSLENKIDRRD